jgi:hypothetical protein
MKLGDDPMLTVHENPIQLEIVGPKMSERGQPNSVAGSFTLSTKTTNTTGNDENFLLRFTTDSGVDAVQALPVSSERHRLRGVVVFPLSAGSAHGRWNTGRVGIRVQLRIGGQKTCPVHIRARNAKFCCVESALAPGGYPGPL